MRNYTRIPHPIPVDHVMSLVDDSTPMYKSVFLHDVEINIGMPNIKVFKKYGTECKCCGIAGNVFYLERTKGDGYSIYHEWHLNLYAQNEFGQEVLMTKDHILPKSKGGENTLENYQPMCEPCNKNKGNKIPEHLTSSTPQISEDEHTLKKIKTWKAKAQQPAVTAENLYTKKISREEMLEKMRHCFQHCKVGIKDKYGLEIDEKGYGDLVLIAATSGKIIQRLSGHKNIREVKFRSKTVWVLYNSNYRLINAIMSPRPQHEYFRIVPSWARDMESAVLAEYDKVLAEARAYVAECKKTSPEITATIAKQFQALDNGKMIFVIWKDSPAHVINDCMWKYLKTKFNIVDTKDVEDAEINGNVEIITTEKEIDGNI
jgi:5-methylcytosine-specific restriction endonuclease McrA